MKKILNWTVGSFFRTIGRTIAFLVMGGLIYYILTYNGFGIEDLFFTKVKAATTVIPVTPYPAELYVNGNGSSGFGTTSDGNTFTKTIYNSSSQIYDYIAFQSSGFDTTRFDYIEFDFNITKPLTTTSTDTEDARVCDQWSCSTTEIDSANNWKYCTRFYCSRYQTAQSGTETNIYSNDLDTLNFQFTVSLTNGWTNTCTLNNNRILCPTYKTQITQLNIYTHFDTSTNTNFDMFISRRVGIYNVSDVSGAINNQTQQQQQQHEEMMDSNTTQAEDEATGFFEDFDVPDAGGLSGVITAPLSTIQSLLNSTCTNLVLPLPFVNEDITLPCMNSIYTEHFGAFFTIYQTIMLAIIAYRCIRSIFFDIHGFTDPNDDRIEVMDL